MKERTVTVTATESEWRAILRIVTRCVGCGGIAEVNLGARARCVACAAPIRRSRCVLLAHAELAQRIRDALSGPPALKERTRG